MRVNAPNTGEKRRNGKGAYSNTFDVQSTVLALYERLGAWRVVASHLGGYSAAYWCLVGRGAIKPSREAENLLRRHLGLAPRRVRRLWDMRVEDLRWYLQHRREL